MLTGGTGGVGGAGNAGGVGGTGGAGGGGDAGAAGISGGSRLVGDSGVTGEGEAETGVTELEGSIENGNTSSSKVTWRDKRILCVVRSRQRYPPMVCWITKEDTRR